MCRWLWCRWARERFPSSVCCMSLRPRICVKVRLHLGSVLWKILSLLQGSVSLYVIHRSRRWLLISFRWSDDLHQRSTLMARRMESHYCSDADQNQQLLLQIIDTDVSRRRFPALPVMFVTIFLARRHFPRPKICSMLCQIASCTFGHWRNEAFLLKHGEYCSTVTRLKIKSARDESHVDCPLRYNSRLFFTKQAYGMCTVIR